MDRESVHRLFELLGSTKPFDHGNWVTGQCPFARWTHKKGTDEHPGFGITVDENSSYHCFACGKTGRIQVLPSVLAKYEGRDRKDLRACISGSESAFNWKKKEVKLPVLVPLDEDILDRYPRLTKHYKSITLKSIERWDLRYDATEKRIIFPVRDSKGRLVAIRGRSTEESCSIRYRTYSELQEGDDAKKCGVWYGEHFGLVHNKFLVLVEGERDAVLLKQAGVSNVWSAMGASITQPQLAHLRNVKNPLLLFFDDDEAGHKARDLVLKTLKTKRIHIVSNYHGLKDPAEIVEKRMLDKVRRSVVGYFTKGGRPSKSTVN